MPPGTRYDSTAPPLAPQAVWRRGLTALALFCGVVYLTWRWGFTLDLGTLWLGLPLVITETLMIATSALLAFSCWRTTDRRPPAPLAGRRSAILIATYDEPEDVLRATLLGALAVRADPAPEVWVLDDGGRDWVRSMCAGLDARYLSRPAPRLHAKAGNLNYALAHVDAEFLVTLDADHVPRPELLERTLGYFSDPKVAVVQGPQAFFNRGFQHPRRSADPLRNDQNLFFDAICPGKDRSNAAFWCGTPAVIRREALVSVGGVATETVVEDAHTSMRLHQAGWATVYHRDILAVGLAPEEVGSFLIQRGRWARGALQMLRWDNPLLARGLTWRQRLHYLGSTLHFLEGLQRLVVLMVPIIVLITGVLPLNADIMLYALLLLPQMVLTPVAAWAISGGRYRWLEGERYAIVRLWVYVRASSALVHRKPAAFRVTPKGTRTREVSPLVALRPQIIIAALSIAAIAYQGLAQALGLPGRLSPFAEVITIGWALINVALLSYTVLWSASVRHRRRGHRFPVSVDAAYTAQSEGTPASPSRVEDLSPYGLSMTTDEELEVGRRVRVVVLMEDGPVTVEGTVTTLREVPGDRGMRRRLRTPLPAHRDRLR